MLIVRRGRTAAAIVGGCVASLALVTGAHAGWTWPENNYLANKIGITRASITPELEEALRSIKEVLAGFDQHVRDGCRWKLTRDRITSALVDLLILNTVHERGTALQGPPEAGKGETLEAGDEVVGREAARFVRFSSAAYGMLMLKGANVMSWSSGWPPIHKFSLDELNAWCISKHCGIRGGDVIKVSNLSDISKRLHLPGYMIAVDHASRSVVLSVRGTFSVQNTLTDLVCDSTEFMGGWCHRGLRRSAETLLEDAKEDLLDQLKRNNGYRLVLCGHSLGAGVSILLTMVILKQKRDLGLGRTEVLCYAFAPPPVFGPADKLPREAQRAIRSFVFGNDMVCRLSLSNAYDLFRELEEVDAIEASLAQRIRYLASERRPLVSVADDGLGVVRMRVAVRYPTILRRSARSRRGGEGGSVKGGDGGSRQGEGWEHPVEAFVRAKLAEDFNPKGTTACRPRGFKRRAKTATEALLSGGVKHDSNGGSRSGKVTDDGHRHRYRELFIPGSVYHLRKLDVESDEGERRFGGSGSRATYWMERKPAQEFAKLLVLDTGIADHLPKSYEDALHTLYGGGLPPAPPSTDRPTDLTGPADDVAAHRGFLNEVTPGFSRDGKRNDARWGRGGFFSRGRIATGFKHKK